MNNIIHIDSDFLACSWYHDLNAKVLYLHLLLVSENSRYVTTIADLARATGITYKCARNGLEKLKGVGLIKCCGANKNTTITLCNSVPYIMLKIGRGRTKKNNVGEQNSFVTDCNAGDYTTPAVDEGRTNRDMFSEIGGDFVVEGRTEMPVMGEQNTPHNIQCNNDLDDGSFSLWANKIDDEGQTNPHARTLSLEDNNNIYNIKIKKNNKEKREEKKETKDYEQEMLDELKHDDAWREVIMMHHKISAEQFFTLLDEFMIDNKCGAQVHQNTSHMKQHFNSWMRIKNDRNNRTKNNTYANRRGNKEVTAQPQEYKETF